MTDLRALEAALTKAAIHTIKVGPLGGPATERPCILLDSAIEAIRALLRAPAPATDGGLSEEQLVNLAGKANAKLHEIFRETDGHEREYCVHGYIEEIIKEALALARPAEPLCEICDKPESDDAHNQLGHNFQSTEEPSGKGCHVCRCGGNGLCKCECHWKTAEEVLAELEKQTKANEEAIRADERAKIAASGEASSLKALVAAAWEMHDWYVKFTGLPAVSLNDALTKLSVEVQEGYEPEAARRWNGRGSCRCTQCGATSRIAFGNSLLNFDDEGFFHWTEANHKCGPVVDSRSAGEGEPTV